MCSVVEEVGGMQILFVEESSCDRLTLSSLFKQEEISCQFSDGALDALRSDISCFDAVVLDGQNGLEVGRRLLDEEIEPPLILLVEAGLEHLAVDALRAGFEDYILKDESEKYLGLLPLVLVNAVEKHRDRLARKEAEHALQKTLEDSRKQQFKVNALLRGARAVLEYREFEQAARIIFDITKALTGARAGYVALLTDDGAENDLLFLDAGGLPCTVNPELPMPIRGLRAVAYRTGKAVYDNAFSSSEWMRFLPEGHVKLHNVMFAPLKIGGQTVGLIGLSNKPEDFTDEDARMATAFGELAAIALLNSRTLIALKESEHIARALINAPTDSIFLIDTENRILDLNSTAAQRLGKPRDELVGMNIFDLSPTPIQAQKSRLKEVFDSGQPIRFEEDQANTWFDTVMYPVADASGTIAKLAIVARDITERKKVQLQEFQLALEKERTRLLSTFVQDATHEFRTPLSTINTHVYLMARTDDPEKRQARADQVQSQINRLTRLVDMMLKMTRLESVTPTFSTVHLAALLERISRTLLSKPGMPAIRCQLDAPLPPVDGDERLLWEAIEALIDNARRFGPEDGTITVGADPHGEYVTIKVQDEGPGISEDIQPHIFETFWRDDKAHSTPGLGLGLPMARKIIQLHGGDIELESEVGKGSIFSIYIPLNQCS